MQIDIRITLDNVSPDVSAQQLADTIENIVRQQTNMDVSTTIYDNDSKRISNPILMHNAMRKIQ